MTALRKHSQTEVAIWLLECGFKPMIVSNQTGISTQRAREFHREIYGVGSKSGQIKSPDGAIRTAAAYMSASYCMSMYAAMTPDYKTWIDMGTLVRAIQLHQKLGLPKNSQLSCNEFYNIALSLRSGCATLEPCSKCGAKHLSVRRMHFAPYCPYCAAVGGP